ncbi:hypothetical protein [Sphingomonas sp.]|uniref:hypothetical protein n=1 Tax=Sphingomonas sp. TaxID=28214 RepID=UPI002D1AC138|nr:hypothetical protein [Sphingomonas sp.]HWK36277.1 hypothetical protein [Sphingomonas sp.]
MKTVLLLAALSVATPALAQNAGAPAAAPAAAAKYTLDTPLETIVADPAARKVLDDTIPGVTTHEAYDMFKSMSLAQLQPMSGGKLTDEALAKVKAALATIK